MIRFLFICYVFFAPFTSYLALSGWVRLPVFFNLLMILVYLILLLPKKTLNISCFFKEDMLLILFLVFVWLSYIFGFKESKSLNHALAYSFTIINLFFFPKIIITNVKNISYDLVTKISYYSFYVVSAIIFLDFSCKNLFDFEIRPIFLNLSNTSTYNMLYFIRSGIYQTGGTAEEPGNMAFFYNIYFCLTLYFLKNNKKTIPILIYIICQIMMLSTAGIVTFLLACFIFYFSWIIKKMKLLFYIVNSFIISILFVLILDNSKINHIIGGMYDKLTFSETIENSSSSSRMYQWSRALYNFIENPVLGKGPGFGVFEDNEGYLNSFLSILSDTGSISFLLFCMFFLVLFYNKNKKNRNDSYSKILYVGLLTGIFHLCIIGDFFSAPFWVLVIVIQLIPNYHKQISSAENISV